MNIFIAITLVAFATSAIPSSASATNSLTDTSIIHLTDGPKSDSAPSHQKDGQCDVGCCISHCFCAGYALPATQTLSVPSIGYVAAWGFYNQKAVSNSFAPQLRPPRILA